MRKPSDKTLLTLAAAILTLFVIGKGIQWRQDKVLHHQNEKTDGTLRLQLKSSWLGDTIKNVSERILSRRKNLQEACVRNSINTNLSSDVAFVKNRYLKTSIFYSDKYKIVFCQIPKCATRSQAKFLAVIEGLITKEEFDSVTEARATSLIEKHVSARRIRSIDQMAKRLNEYKKVVIVREPFSRILSAFRNKLEGNRRKDGYANLARNLHTKYGNGTQEEQDGAPVINLSDFVSYLIDKDDVQHDQHWNYFNRLCSPCELKYDYIIHMDTMDEDMQYVMKEFGIHGFTFPPSYDSLTDKNIVKKYFSHVPLDLVNSLYDRYQMDYELFDFSTPPRF